MAACAYCTPSQECHAEFRSAHSFSRHLLACMSLCQSVSREQCVRECGCVGVCRRTGYRPMMTILASRERFCLHPDIAVAPNKTEACEGATLVGHMDCSYLENAEASWYPQVLQCVITPAPFPLFDYSCAHMHTCLPACLPASLLAELSARHTHRCSLG